MHKEFVDTRGAKHPSLAIFEKFAAAPYHSRLAQFAVGECYFSGFGCQQNQVKAVQAWNDAAKKGNSLAMSELGYVSCYGTLTMPADREQAKLWWHRAVYYGKDASSAYRLALDLALQFPSLSNVWMAMAAKGGVVAAQEKMKCGECGPIYPHEEAEAMLVSTLRFCI